MHQLKAVAGLAVARNDLVANVFSKIIKDWVKEDPCQWVIHTETSYRHTNAEGTTIGLFSNLPSRIGKEVSDLPFFQIEAGHLPKHLPSGEFKKSFGVEDYFGEELDNVRRMLVPFLTYATLLNKNSSNFLWNIQVGNVSKQEPLIVSFKCQRTLVRLAVYGHVLIDEARMIAMEQNKVVTITLEEGAEKLIKDNPLEKMLEQLKANPDKSVYRDSIVSGDRLGFVENPRIEDDRIVVDVRFTDPKRAEQKWASSLVFSVELSKEKKKVSDNRKVYLTLNECLDESA